MLRGAGGATIPYSLFYILIAVKPVQRKWALTVIGFANVVAIILDLASVFMNEYKLAYAMYDIPVETLSLIGIGIVLYQAKSGKGNS